MKFVKSVFIFSLVLILLGVASVFGLYLYYEDELPSVDVLQDVELQTPMRIYTQDGALISQYGIKRRIPVSLEDVPETLVQALIATEDSRFYEHVGVDPIGVLRAVVNLVATGEKGQGASTLTMQLARGFFGLTRKKEYSRKIKEVFIALKMEQELSKDQILELYLNKVELGHRSFGVGAAAQVYYGKSLNELTLAQLATIAGLPQRPSASNPITNPRLSKERRRVVLLRMLDEGYITREQFDEAAAAPVTAKKHGAEIEVDAPYLADIAYNEMIEIYGKEIAENSGFQVYTSAYSHTQIAAQKAVLRNLHDYDERHGYRGPLSYIWNAPPAETDNEELSTEISESALQEAVPNEQPALEVIQHALGNTEAIDALIPAAVMQVEERSVQVLTLEYGEITLDWDGLDWARKYIDDNRQGSEPEQAADILSEGMLVYVRQREQDKVWQLSQFPVASGAFVALNPFDGAVEAVVGGYSFYHSQFNRATQAKRQVGSNIKPFVYAAAIDSGYTIASLINDAPINQWDASSGVAWRPQNSPAVYDGPIRMRVALGKSKNVVSVRLLRGVGLEDTRDYITRFGFDRNEVPLDETMSLGSGAHTPLEVASGIATIKNGGFAVRPYFIERIENSDGQIIWQVEPVYACDPCEGFDRSGKKLVIEEDVPPEEIVIASTDEDLEAQLAAQFANDNQLDLALPTNDDASSLVGERPPMQPAPRVISEQTAFLVSEMMRTAVRANGNWNNKTYWLGTGWRARNILERTDIGGKTGTTNDSRDTWFSGFAPGYVATAWVGFDDNVRQLGRATRNPNLIAKNPDKHRWIGNAMIGVEDGAKAAQPAWIYFMKEVLKDTPQTQKSIPGGIVRVRIDRNSGKLSRNINASSMFEYFVKGTEPTIFESENSLELPIEDGTKTTEAIEELF
ncbi:penicillin-binding protein 1A [Glaciecola petra]|uniref:Penicillin-binding protein 1A n=1 Tax=Glaciecola petra TaxID=3075602 RepID=A0ABU2ZSD6_9ALTE|nr:penicillin-binding protein 1A [Aestuariibacter sp. P117]MDT0595525.1 penicillin-binding protein 1A [Aestuariibacter sp. P117]